MEPTVTGPLHVAAVGWHMCAGWTAGPCEATEGRSVCMVMSGKMIHAPPLECLNLPP